MNSFVRDGAVNRKRRARLSLTTRNNEPQRKKIHKTNDYGTTPVPRYLEGSTSRILGESSVSQSTIAGTEKESRFSNIEFMRSKAFLYLNYKKISPHNINKLLKEHLKQFDENETQLKRIFEQCYDLTGSVEKSKAMMKQLETNPCLRLDLGINLSSEVSYRRLSILPCKVVEKTVKIVKQTKDKKSMPIRLKKQINMQIIKLFGKVHSKKDKKILYSKIINDYNKTPKTDYYSDTTTISDEELDENEDYCCVTKYYSVHDPEINSLEVNEVTNPNTDVLGHSNLLINPQLNTDANVQNAAGFALETVNDIGQIIVPQFKISEIVENSKDSELGTKKNILQIEIGECVRNAMDSELETKIDVEENVLQVEIDECVRNAKDLELKTKIDAEENVLQAEIDECVQNAKYSELKTKKDAEENVLQVEIDECVQNAKDSELETTKNGEENVLQVEIDECVQNAKDSDLKTKKDAEENVLQVEIDECVQNAKDSELETRRIDVEENVLQAEIDECVQNAKDSELETKKDAEENVLQVEMDECVQNAKDSELKTKKDAEENVLQVEIDECVQNAKYSELETKKDAEENVLQVEIDECVQNAKDSELEMKINVEENVLQIEINECVQNVKDSELRTNIDDGEIIDLELEKCTIAQDLVNSQVNAFDIDIADLKTPSEILDHTNIVLKIRKIINPDDKVFKNSIIKDLATYFLNDDFLSKVDALWKTTESKLVGELIIKLLNKFNDTKYNMAQFTGCLICIFREIAQKSSILPCQMKFKLIVLLDAIKKYIKFHDNELWRNWFLPSMFFDWCFIVACIFMNTKNEFKIDLNKSVIRNATSYYKKVKENKYLFIPQDSKPSKSHKKTGIFELTRIDDLLEIDDVHATNDTIVIPDIPSNELEFKKLETDDSYIDTINLTTPENVEDVCIAPSYPKISVCPEFRFSNSFIKKSNWFTGTASEIMKKCIKLSPNESIKSSTIQNNSTFVGNNKELSSVNKRRSATNKSTKSKKSKTQFEPPRVFFTIANNPTEFDITYGSPSIPQMSTSSVIAQMPSSSVVTQMSSSSAACQANLQVTSSSEVPKTSSLSAIPHFSSSSVVPQNSSSSAVSQNVGPYYNNFSSSNTGSQFPVTAVPRNLSIYYNNIVPDVTQVPFGLQTRQSISSTTQSSNANPPVDKNVTSTLHPFYSDIQPPNHHQHSTATNSRIPKAANTWPSNIYSNLCSDPSYSKSSTYHTQYANSAPSYPQSLYNHNIPSATLHPKHSNALTYPTNYTLPISSDLLTITTARPASMSTYMENQNYNYGNSYSSQNNFHNSQVSPDLPDARLPNMPNHQNSNTIKKTCMAANCTNTSSFSCNTCTAAFYCSAQCQKSDWHYHQNECHLSF